jgi:hypothetical protein
MTRIFVKLLLFVFPAVWLTGFGTLRVPNRSHYIDYQDCKYLGGREALCSGLNMYQPKKDGPRFALGGSEIVDLTANQAIYQVPVELWTEGGLPMTYNPF